MNTHDKIELPPLPEWVDWPVTVSEMSASEIKEAMQAYARAAIEADRKRRGEPVAWRWKWKDLPDAGWQLSSVGGWREADAIKSEPLCAEPVVKDSLTVAEPVKVPSDGRYAALLAERDALREALTELCDEIDKHEIHAAISKTNISWFKRKARKALAQEES